MIVSPDAEVSRGYADLTLSCVECESEFVWTAGEQDFYDTHEFQPPKRCQLHRKSARQDAESSEYAPLLKLRSIYEYWDRFTTEYCDTSPIETCDSVKVYFKPADFWHAFYEGDQKEAFAWRRAKRIDWIREALTDPAAELYQGLNREAGCYSPSRRVTLVNGNYVVIVEFSSPHEADFVTAFDASLKTVLSIRESPVWGDTTMDRRCA